MIPFVIQEIRRLSQEEGLYDQEIADQIGVSRATVNRTRQENNIPKANLANRKDKKIICPRCKQTWITKRGHRGSHLCPECRPRLVPPPPPVE